MTKTSAAASRRKQRPQPRVEGSSTTEPTSRRRPSRTLVVAGIGSLLMFAALPPLNWGLLGWLAPIPWLLLVRQPRLDTRRPGWIFFLAGLAYWLGTIHWLRLPHPATHLGWLALASYLACYIPVFMGITRLAVHRYGVSLVVAAPVVWVGLEYARAYLLTGFSMGYLGHSQYAFAWVIQIADLFGAYGVSFLVMAVAACLARIIPLRPSMPVGNSTGAVAASADPQLSSDSSASSGWTWWPLPVAVGLLLATLTYGRHQANVPLDGEVHRIALVQTNAEQTLKLDPTAANRIFRDLTRLTAESLYAHNPELIIWPETMYRFPLFTISDPEHVTVPEGASVEWLTQAQQLSRREVERIADAYGTTMLIGIDTRSFTPERNGNYNSAVLVDPQRGIVGRYNKMHRVMFGEYVPFGDVIPLIYRLTPLHGGILAGDAQQAPLATADLQLSPSICFESTVPQLVRNQVLSARRAGSEPDVLVNLTNDGWFWGSSELDMHLICSVFRAVECRKPMLIAANTGLSAHIDSAGSIRWQGPRQQEAWHVANVQLDSRNSLYLAWGDWPAALCLAACGLCLIGPVRDRWQRRQHDTGDH